MTSPHDVICCAVDTDLEEEGGKHLSKKHIYFLEKNTQFMKTDHKYEIIYYSDYGGKTAGKLHVKGNAMFKKHFRFDMPNARQIIFICRNVYNGSHLFTSPQNLHIKRFN